MKPITPSQAKAKRLLSIPEYVIEVFNDLIAKNLIGNKAIVKQDEAIAEIIFNSSSKGTPVTREQIFNNHWLDIEELYEEAGWDVDYDKPAYDESYKPYFTFSVKRCF